MGDPGKREIHVRYGEIKGRYGAIGGDLGRYSLEIYHREKIPIIEVV
jgi:hypothetical protein